jgi:tetratricopeptide (TPR) repeat protein
MKTKAMYGVMVALLLALGAGTAWSQATAGKVQGKITSGGKPVPNAQVVLTNEDNGRVYKMKTDKNGAFNGVGIAFGNYDEEVLSESGEKLYKKTKVPVTGEGGKIDDVSLEIGSGGAPAMSKEEVEKLKAQNEKAMNENALISQLNPALQAKNWQAAEPILQQLVTMAPNNWEYQQALGTSQLNLGKFEEAVGSYEKAIPLAENAANSKDPKQNPEKAKAAVAGMLNNEGAAYTKLKQPQKAVEAYTKAAAMDPNPGTAYFNLCATQYNTGNTQGALAACDKAIAADPNRADAYYIKGSLMMAESKQDKDGKLTAPPGTAEAFNKYLELAPDGPHANDVKQMLAYIGAKIETTYKEKKKK